MFRVTLLPARFGDSLWIEYGSNRAPHRVLIDGGTRGTRHVIRRLLDSGRGAAGQHLELLVVSHVDRDHIEGVLGLLEEADKSLNVGDVWFNGWRHLLGKPGVEALGPVQGERLTTRIVALDLPWNRGFDSAAVQVEEKGNLPRRTLPGGLEITILSPTPAALARLRPVWEVAVEEANLVPGSGLDPNDDARPGDESFTAADLPDVEALANSKFEDDSSVANGSSIAFLAEFEGRRVLFAADAPVGTLTESLERLSPGEPVQLDLFKISHHGSRNTTSRELIQKVSCPRFAFSTNGSNFEHPHDEAVARVIMAGGDAPELVFNYRSKWNSIWDNRVLKVRHGYTTVFPAEGKEGITIEL